MQKSETVLQLLDEMKSLQENSEKEKANFVLKDIIKKIKEQKNSPTPEAVENEVNYHLIFSKYLIICVLKVNHDRILKIFPVPDSIRDDPHRREKLITLIKSHGIDVSPLKSTHQKKRLIDFESIGADKVVQDRGKNEQILDITDLTVDAVKKMNENGQNLPQAEAVRVETKKKKYHKFYEQYMNHVA